jgi:hypothetical protein
MIESADANAILSGGPGGRRSVAWGIGPRLYRVAPSGLMIDIPEIPSVARAEGLDFADADQAVAERRLEPERPAHAHAPGQ